MNSEFAFPWMWFWE